MHRMSRVFALTALAALVPLSAQAAPKTGHVMFHPSLHTMGFNKVMATASLKYTKHDTTITFHASHLPNPQVLHKKVYVLWATAGGMRDKVGAITLKNGTGTLMASVMMTKITDLVVTANKSVNGRHGETVLSGMTGM